MPQEGNKVVYLTFDDGPVPGVTTWLLDLLSKYKIKGTFFCVGENIFKYPFIYSRIVQEGHSTGNHTYNHLQGLKSTNNDFFRNIRQADALIGSNLFRPPHGLLKRSQYRYLVKKYKIVMWDVISCDYNRNIPKEEVLNNVLEFTRPGSIITFHDSYKAEPHLRWVLPRAIEALKSQGYEFRRIEFPKERRIHSSSYLEKLTRLRQNLKRRRWA